MSVDVGTEWFKVAVVSVSICNPDITMMFSPKFVMKYVFNLSLECQWRLH